MLSAKLRFREVKFSSIPFHRYDHYDIIHLHGPTCLLSDLMLLTNGDLRIVYTHHAEISWLSDRLFRIYRKTHRILARKAKAVIVHSYDYADLFTTDNVVVVRMPCPFEPPSDVGLKAQTFTVLYVGQLRPFKGIDILIRVASSIRDIRFVVAGDGYLRQKLTRMAEGLENVSFAHRLRDEELKRLYEKAHVICLPSVNTTEAYGLVLIEGAIYGCIPLASNLIGIRENVSLLNGILFDRGSCTSLAEKILVLKDDRDKCLNLAKRSFDAASNYARAYNPEYYVKKHEAIFRGVCEG